ncbi:ABC transporter ATP-binding protein [Virgibacillus siamensis]|uniref:ABC transporter ATP-binding protein n=1 Tax=Virgibacillus siamensis TaxID=480071 RepID=UPI000986080D|nr:ABC transporter ATP-binding protein [Virgibacillus siamensis]
MIIEMENVYLIRHEKTIISNINWKVEKGEHTTILGMNGAGKTTLLNLVCGYLYPTKGTIKVFDKQFGTYPLGELRKDIGWVSSSLIEKMKHQPRSTALQVVLSGKFASIGLYEKPCHSDVEKATNILEQLGIAHLRNQSFEMMSQGEKQRVLIGRALMASPKLLILDEPCAGLDFLSKEKLLNIINQLATYHQTTIIYVTHQIDEILPICTNTLLVKDGFIFSKGKTKDLLTSETMSNFCNTPVIVSHQHNRFHLEVSISR